MQTYDTDEEIILLMDNTVFGNAKDGMVLTTKRIMWHNIGEKNLSVNYSDITKIEMQEKSWGTGKLSTSITA